MSDSSPRVVVVHRQPALRRLMAVALRLAGCEVIEADRGSEAAQAVRDNRATLLVSSVELPDMSGSELAAAVRAGWNSPPAVILTSAYGHPPRGAEDAFLPEPFGPEQLVEAARPFIGDRHEWQGRRGQLLLESSTSASASR